MLGKTANGLFWMYRYLERAENTARLIETGQRIALTRLGHSDSEWGSVMEAGGALHGFQALGQEMTKDNAIDWMLRSKDNPSSVLSAISSARQNARLVRTALTHEIWEATNAAYMAACDLLARKVAERDLPQTLAKVRQSAAQVRGMTHGTMLRDEAYNFTRLGTFLERADSTTRILDVKYYVLLPSASAVGTSLDNVQWESLLRSLSARGGFRTQYGNSGGAREIAEFLILSRQMPRSLAFCVGKIRSNLRFLCDNAPETSPAMQCIDEIEQRCLDHTIDSIFEFGLHEFLQDMLNSTSRLAHEIETEYRFYA